MESVGLLLDEVDLRDTAPPFTPTREQMIDYMRSIEGGTLRDRLIRATIVQVLQDQEMMVE